jgi:hypothetical protein
MTEREAALWNAGEMSEKIMGRIIVNLPRSDFNDRQITLRRAVSERLEPEIAKMMIGMPANRCS